jgi:hypothetical protein
LLEAAAVTAELAASTTAVCSLVGAEATSAGVAAVVATDAALAA